MSTEDNQRIWQALDDYFLVAGTERDKNVQLMHNLLGRDFLRYKNALIYGGFIWLLEALEKQGEIAHRQGMIGTPDIFINQEIYALANTRFQQLLDIVGELSPDICTRLIAAITTSDDEDEIALMALMVAKYITQLDKYQFDISKTYLLGRYQELFGTSCKMAMAWALYNFGKLEYWENFVFDDENYYESFRTQLEERIKFLAPNADWSKRKEYLCREIAEPGSTNIGVPPHEGLLEVIALDVASNGKRFSPRPNWKRMPRKNI